jgi:hypothetical protein
MNIRATRTISAAERELAHQLRNEFAMVSPARSMHVDDMRERAYRLLENVSTVASELRDLLDQLDGTAPRVNTRGLIERLRTAEVELDAAVVCLAGELGLVEE